MSTAKVLFPNDEEIYKILKGLPNTEKLQNKIWESFCLENENTRSKNTSPRKSRFKKHPHNFDKKKDDSEDDSNDSGNRGEDDCISMCSDDIAEVLFSTKFKNKERTRTKCQSAKCLRASAESNQDDEYDSLDEYCDVTFRNIRSVIPKHQTKNSIHIEEMKSPTTKQMIPSVIPSKPTKMMLPIKPKKSILKETTENPSILQNTTKIEVCTTPTVYDMNKDRRLKMVLQKCNNAMDDIRLLIDIGIPQPDGDEDYFRRKKRALEFSSRFSRIYLYQLNRLINDIRKLLRPHTTQKALHTSSVKMNLCARTNITQKFIQTLQLVQQGLQAYYNHLPSSIIIGVPEKLKDLLNLCNTICQLQNVVISTPGGGDKGDADNVFTPFSTRSKSLLDRIIECCQIDSTASLLKCDRSKLSMLGYNVTKGKRVGDVNNKMQLSVNARFSMYGGGGNGRGSRKEAYWRNAIAALGKKHFNVSSRYKTAKFKHRPDVDRMQLLPNQHQPLFQAFPINLKPVYNEHGDFTSNMAGTNMSCQQGYGKQSDMSIRQVVAGGGPSRRGRPRYSLNDDEVNTMMQNVRDDGGKAAVIGPGALEGEGSSGGEVLSRRRNKSGGRRKAQQVGAVGRSRLVDSVVCDEKKWGYDCMRNGLCIDVLFCFKKI